MKLLLISKDNDLQKLFKKLFTKESELTVLDSIVGIKKHTPKSIYNVIFCELEFYKDLPFKHSDVALASTMLGYDPAETRIVILSSKKQIKEALMYIKSASLNYITHPVTEHEVLYFCHNNPPKKVQFTLSDWLPEDAGMLRTANPQMRSLYDQIKLVSMKATTVLLTGETGTGKGIAAKLLHSLSNRRDKPFISIHCGALPETLLESELFGHEKGSFTGASKQKKGKFELAQGGTVFLDEIGTISLKMQIKLLEVLQEKSIVRIGGEKSIELDIRVIAATNEDLVELCQKGTFRKDLYYRLNVFPLHVPPLRERAEDLPIICASLIQKFNLQHGKNIKGLDPLMGDALRNYTWPGNIRELENLFERAFILESSDTLTSTSFPTEILANVSNSESFLEDTSGTLALVRQQVVAQIEEDYIKSVLAANNGSIQKTASVAGVTTRQLHKLMTRYAIDKNDYKL
jgi:DNA-binding NtrC family response regulator